MNEARTVTKPQRVTSAWIAADIRGLLESGRLGASNVLRSERELAEQYGVARTTVRRALRRLVAGGYLVSQPRQGYEVAGDVKSRAALVAFVNDSPEGPWDWNQFQMHFWTEFQRIAADSGNYLLAVGVERRSPEEMAAHLASLGVRGVILDSDDPGMGAGIRAAGLPVVQVDAAFPGMPAVTQDNFGGAFLATAHLISKGHRRIAWLGRDPHPLRNRIHFTERLGGYTAAMRDAGLGVDAELQLDRRGQGPEEGAEALLELAHRGAGIDAAVVFWPEYSNALGKAISAMASPPELAVWWGCLPDARENWRRAFPDLPVPAGVAWDFEALARMALRSIEEQTGPGALAAGRWLVPAELVPGENR